MLIVFGIKAFSFCRGSGFSTQLFQRNTKRAFKQLLPRRLSPMDEPLPSFILKGFCLKSIILRVSSSDQRGYKRLTIQLNWATFGWTLLEISAIPDPNSGHNSYRKGELKGIGTNTPSHHLRTKKSWERRMISLFQRSNNQRHPSAICN